MLSTFFFSLSGSVFPSTFLLQCQPMGQRGSLLRLLVAKTAKTHPLKKNLLLLCCACGFELSQMGSGLETFYKDVCVFFYVTLVALTQSGNCLMHSRLQATRLCECVGLLSRANNLIPFEHPSILHPFTHLLCCRYKSAQSQ